MTASFHFGVSVVFTFVAAAAALWATAAWKRAARDRAAALAERLGLDFELRSVESAGFLDRLPPVLRPLADLFASWRISGERGGVSVWMYPEVRSHGKSSSTYLVVEARFSRPFNFELRAGRETVFDKIGKALFSLPDVEIGDWDFDDKVRIKAADAEAARELFSALAVREALRSLLDACPEAFVVSYGAVWERGASRAAYEKVPAVLDPLVAFAAAVDAVMP